MLSSTITLTSGDAGRSGLRALKDLNATSRRKSICKAGSARRALAKPPPYSQRPWEHGDKCTQPKATFWQFTATTAWKYGQKCFCNLMLPTDLVKSPIHTTLTNACSASPSSTTYPSMKYRRFVLRDGGLLASARPSTSLSSGKAASLRFSSVFWSSGRCLDDRRFGMDSSATESDRIQ